MKFDILPATYSPAYNPILHVMSSTYSEVLYFNLQVNDVQTGGRIINDKAYVAPITPTASHYNISDIGRDLVKWQIVNDGSLYAVIDDSVRKIQISGSDYGVIGTTMSQLGATASTGNRWIWNGKLARHKFTDYNYNDWVLSSTSTRIKFLTEKPNYSLVNDYSRDFLYYLKQESYGIHYVNIQVYSTSNSYLRQWTTEIPSYTTKSMLRLDVSPKAIKKVYFQQFPDLPTQILDNAGYYCVTLKNNMGITASETKCYKYKADPDCGHDIVNILWENPLGGIDSYQFIQAVETKNVERFNIMKNFYGYDDTGKYSDIEQSTYYNRERVIHNNESSQWAMWTRVLTNDENNWISSILFAKGWWVELKNGRTYPVTLNETTYTVNNQKYQRSERLQSQFTFNILDEVIKDNQIYAGTASIALIPTTTTTTTTLPITTTTTTVPASTTTTTTVPGSTTTTTSVAATQFDGCGRGTSTIQACDDATLNNRTFWSNCSTINDGCIIYVDSASTTRLLGYTHIKIDNLSWRISQTNGVIQYLDVVQC